MPAINHMSSDKMKRIIFTRLSKLPMPLNHSIGAVFGQIAFRLSPRLRKMMRENVAQSGLANPELHNTFLSQAIAESGKGITELAIAWTAPLDDLRRLVQACSGWDEVDALSKNNGIIFVTPHLGCYDIAGRYLASRLPITALYRPPKQTWLEPIMEKGRSRGGAVTVPADSSGVRALLKTLKTGGNIMILPDQVPGKGDGVWADFFGRPAYTMTLLPRLAESTGAKVVFFFAERLANGAGYHVHFVPMNQPFDTDKDKAARQTNEMIEKLIRMAPTQYLWGYNRYKHPAGAPLPPMDDE